ncbi:competence protein ComL [Cellvibrio japonicus Ueda107]|uniref:Outer membrane protein assembly factor BamD n=2 Tax=Cellvibrio japonicus TaxID=155077 RepID=B3PE03_CELJU|nr:competence protein ComL [Cellvibrio japonicus Ueda107]
MFKYPAAPTAAPIYIAIRVKCTMQVALRALPLLVLSLILVITGCASKEKEPKVTTEADLYQAAERQLNNSQWQTAIKNLQTLEENFPFGTYAEQAQLELIYAYYMSGEPDAAIATANRFIRLHPQHRNVDYAYYMLGMSSFTKDKGMFERVLPVDITRRDPGAARESLANFTQLLNRYPDSAYAADAKKRMLFLRNLLARYEIHVANYYFKRGAYIAAVGRGRYVLENFPKTPAIPDALAVMVQGYRLMSMSTQADEMLEILRTNYPNYPALDKDGQFNDRYMYDDGHFNLFAWLTFGLFSKSEVTGFDTRELYDPQYIKAPAKSVN